MRPRKIAGHLPGIACCHDLTWRQEIFILMHKLEPKWRNWQTRYVQGVVLFGECGFDSHLRHNEGPGARTGFLFCWCGMAADSIE